MNDLTLMEELNIFPHSEPGSDEFWTFALSLLHFVQKLSPSKAFALQAYWIKVALLDLYKI